MCPGGMGYIEALDAAGHLRKPEYLLKIFEGLLQVQGPVLLVQLHAAVLAGHFDYRHIPGRFRHCYRYIREADLCKILLQVLGVWQNVCKNLSRESRKAHRDTFEGRIVLDKELGSCFVHRGHLGDEHRLSAQLTASHLQHNKCGVDTVALRCYIVPALLAEVLHLLLCHQLSHGCDEVTAFGSFLVVHLLGILFHLPLQFCHQGLGIAGQQGLHLTDI